jgi:hypothetical protein
MLLKVLDFDDNRVGAAVLLNPKVVDRESFSLALDVKSTKRDEVRKRLNLD